MSHATVVTLAVAVALVWLTSLAFTLWGAVDAGARDDSEWLDAGVSRRRWIVGPLLLQFALGLGGLLTWRYLTRIRPRLHSHRGIPTVFDLDDPRLAGAMSGRGLGRR